jgi:hypothetical protein
MMTWVLAAKCTGNFDELPSDDLLLDLSLRLQEMLSKLAVDANRYRWLRTWRSDDELPSVQSVCVGCIGVTLNDEDLDDAIDAAMTGKTR